MTRCFPEIAGLILALTLCGCSTFQRDWKAATAEPPPAGDVTGPWEGRWHSDASGHEGSLRCLVSRTDENTCVARFHARYWRILSFKYPVTLTTQPTTGGVGFQGKADLGRLAGGEYHYEGTADAQRFRAAYLSASDHGSFDMTRPGASGP